MNNINIIIRLKLKKQIYIHFDIHGHFFFNLNSFKKWNLLS